MIRQATIEDLPEVARLSEEFRRVSSLAFESFDAGLFCAFWTVIFEANLGVIFVYVKDGGIVGAIGGVAHREPYSVRRTLQEFFWIVLKSAGALLAGGRLYHEFERWGVEQQCHEIRMGYLMDSMPEEVRRFYERSGFRQREVAYFKELTSPTPKNT